MMNEEVIKILEMHRDSKLCDADCLNGLHCDKCAEVFDKAIDALEKINRIQEIMAMPIQENAVKYLAIYEVMNK